MKKDQWTIKRLTLNLGVRFDYLNASASATHLPAGPFVPARDFPEVPCVPCWKDVVPRLGAAYDLFGNGKTAVKVNLGKFVGGQICGNYDAPAAEHADEKVRHAHTGQRLERIHQRHTTLMQHGAVHPPGDYGTRDEEQARYTASRSLSARSGGVSVDRVHA